MGRRSGLILENLPLEKRICRISTKDAKVREVKLVLLPIRVNPSNPQSVWIFLL